MGRKLRIHRLLAFYHIMLRGNNGEKIFYFDHDRSLFCLQMQKGIELFKHRIHGFCLMSNHVHLIIQIGDVPLSRVIQHLAGGYSMYINNKYNRIGHLFQGRFKSILVDEQKYLLELMRYVHLNPVRANIVTKPEDYFWSGHRTYLGLDEMCWMTQEWILRKFEIHEQVARKLYEKFVLRGIGQEVSSEFYNETHQGSIIESENYGDKVRSSIDCPANLPNEFSLDDLLAAVGNVLKLPVAEIKSTGRQRNNVKARAVCALLIRNSSNLSLQEFANVVGKDISSLNRHASELERLIQSEAELGNPIEKIKEILKSDLVT